MEAKGQAGSWVSLSFCGGQNLLQPSGAPHTSAGQSCRLTTCVGEPANRVNSRGRREAPGKAESLTEAGPEPRSAPR